MYELRVVMKDIEPPVWRTIQVPESTTLHRLHQVLQVAMGWTNSHLYLFHVGGKTYGEPSPEWESEVLDATITTLEQIVSHGNRSFVYEYDLGDSWMHEISLQRTVEAGGEERPRCPGGARACPPEECGGPWGYEEFLRAISDPSHEEHERFLEWVGGHFDPEEFEAAAVDQALRIL